MKSSVGSEQESFPGARSLNAFVKTYQRAWQNHFDTLNAVWGDMTSGDAKMSSWTSGLSKLLQTWSDSASSLYGVWMGGPACPSPRNVVTFVFDAETQAAGQPQSVPLPHGVNVADIASTDLVPIGGGPPIDKSRVVLTPDASGLNLEIGIADLTKVAGKEPQYTAVVFERRPGKGGAAPPSLPLAFVVVAFDDVAGGAGGKSSK
jgi:hypothetical protein